MASKFIRWYHKDCYRHSGSFHCYRCYCSATTVTSATTTTITDPNASYVTRTQPLTSYLTATNSRIMTTLPPPLPSPSPSSFWLHHPRHTNTTKTLLPFLISWSIFQLLVLKVFQVFLWYFNENIGCVWFKNIAMHSVYLVLIYFQQLQIRFCNCALFF